MMTNAGLTMDKNGQWNTALGKKIDMADFMNIGTDDIAAKFRIFYRGKCLLGITNLSCSCSSCSVNTSAE